MDTSTSAIMCEEEKLSAHDEPTEGSQVGESCVPCLLDGELLIDDIKNGVDVPSSFFTTRTLFLHGEIVRNRNIKKGIETVV
ncbi:hypothetical protein ABG067_006769 [Albugo candida]